MRNFPKDFRRALAAYSDAKGVRLSDRVRRLSKMVDVLWQQPEQVTVRQLFNRHLAKFLRGVNYNRLFRQRFELRADGVGAFDAKREEDERPRIVLDEGNLEESFQGVRPLFDLQPTADAVGNLIRGMGVMFLNYFILHLYGAALICCREDDAPAFPERLLEEVDKVLAGGAGVWCAGTAVRDRYRAVRIVHGASCLTPDQKQGVMDVCALLAKTETPEMAPPDVVARIRICELYHAVWPYLTGRRSFKREGARQQDDILREVDSLVEHLCRRERGVSLVTQREEEIRWKVERRLARSIGMNNDDLGWKVYRAMREGGREHRYRTDYIFKELLENDKDRLAVLNVIYRNKTRTLTLSDPRHERVCRMMAKKYQPYFSDSLEINRARDAFVLTHEESHLDLGELDV